MKNALLKAKGLRILRRWPAEVWEEFVGPIFNRGQMLTVLAGAVGTAILIRDGDINRVATDLSAWELSANAFAYVLLIWAAVSAIRAPFIIVAKDRAQGKWHGSRFVYHAPLLVHTARCKATGKIEMYRFHFEDAEPDSFVYYSVETDAAATNRVGISVDGIVMMGDFPFGQIPTAGRFGIRIGDKRQALLRVKMLEGTNSITVRVYCHDFSIGDGDDNDGQTGDHKFKI